MMANNLDSTINKIGHEIVKNRIVDENQINKMIGVLSNDGVYAWWVYTKKELDWKFTSNPEEFKIFPLIALLVLLNELKEFFGKEILDEDGLKQICELQKVIQEENKKNKKDKKIINEKRKQQNDLMNNFFLELSKNLNDLLFFREILEKVLIYARYHAKAMGDS